MTKSPVPRFEQYYQALHQLLLQAASLDTPEESSPATRVQQLLRQYNSAFIMLPVTSLSESERQSLKIEIVKRYDIDFVRFGRDGMSADWSRTRYYVQMQRQMGKDCVDALAETCRNIAKLWNIDERIHEPHIRTILYPERIPPAMNKAAPNPVGEFGVVTTRQLRLQYELH